MNEGERNGHGLQRVIPALPDFDQVLKQVDRDSQKRELPEFPAERAEGDPEACSSFKRLSGLRNL
jgi:hypothetical protein